MATGPKSNSTPTRESLATREGLEAWLRTQSREIAVAIAVRAALRVLPLLAESRAHVRGDFAETFARALRALSIARARVRRLKLDGFEDLTRRTDFTERSYLLGRASERGDATIVAGATAASAADAAHAALFGDAAAAASASVQRAALAVSQYVLGSNGAHQAEMLRMAAASDSIEAIERPHASILERPLWPDRTPLWAREAWANMSSWLPANEDWQVWTDWYESCLRGGPRSGAYELVFATVPEDVWAKGAKAANAWIRYHLAAERSPDPEPTEPLQQRAALYNFALKGERVGLAPEVARPEDREATQDFLDEARRKAAELRDRLGRAQADERLQATLRRLAERLAASLGELRVGMVVSALTSLEADFHAYDTEAGRKEHAADLIAGLADLADTIRLLVGQYPRAREILANQLALGLSETAGAVEAAEAASARATSAAADAANLVEPGVVAALLDPPIDRSDRHSLADRAKQAALRLGALFNFGVVTAEARDLAAKSWVEARKQIPKGAGLAAKATVAGAPLVALDLWLGAGAVALLVQAAAALGAASVVLGKRGGPFDRVMRLVERSAAEKPDPSKPRASTKAPRKKSGGKPQAALPAPER